MSNRWIQEKIKLIDIAQIDMMFGWSIQRNIRLALDSCEKEGVADEVLG